MAPQSLLYLYKMTQQDLINLISKEFNLPKAESERIIKFIEGKILQELTSGNRLYFTNLGSFKKVLHPPRKYRNLHTNKIETLPARYEIHFKTSAPLLKKLNKQPPPSQQLKRLKPPEKKKPKRKITLRKLIKLFTP